jgi:hypothetical protein
MPEEWRCKTSMTKTITNTKPSSSRIHAEGAKGARALSFEEFFTL